ncbi:MAG: hypothetical protein JWO08_39 [Verrucomicrobiaceae bacterium]|nr:hypothetical protein [Verrucomicrobiaceae bacterium]
MPDDPPQLSEHRPLRPLWPWMVAALVILPLIGLAFTYWSLSHSAESRWAAVQKRLADTHHTLDFMSLVPPPVPDDQNFYAIPPLKDIALVIDDDEEAGETGARRKQLLDLKIDMKYPDAVSPYPRYCEGMDYGIPLDPAAWAAFFRETEAVPMPAPSGNDGSDILRALQSRKPLLDALNAGNQRPLSQPTPAVKDRPPVKSVAEMKLSHLTPLLAALNTLELHAEAAKFSGDTARAVKDISTMLRLSEGAGQEPVLIGVLVAETGFAISLRPVWSILQARSADALQLERLAHDLNRVDLQGIVIKAMRGELTFCAASAESDPAELRALLATPTVSNLLHHDTFAENLSGVGLVLQLRMNPSAVIRGNKAALVDLMLTHCVQPLEIHGLQGLPTMTKKLVRENIENLAPGIFGLYPAQSLPQFGGVLMKALLVSVRLDQARTACALERYFIKNGSYPEDLSKLVPEFLSAMPTDPMNGRPMHYQRTGDRYKLWTVGPDGDDDGGTVEPGHSDDPRFPRLQDHAYPGDWVWSYERLVPEDPPPPSKRKKAHLKSK